MVTRAYCGAINPQLLSLMAKYETSLLSVSHDPLTQEELAAGKIQLTPDEISLSSQLYYMLMLMCTDRALDKISGAKTGVGIEAWRILCQEYEPKQAARFASDLMRILGYEFNATDLTASLEAWERLVREYEARTEVEIPEFIKAGIIMLRLPSGPVSQHIVLNAASMTSFDKVRKEVDAIRNAQNAAAYAAGGTQAMDIGALGKGAGGKSGKQKKKGKCHNCGREGHHKHECRQPGGGAHKDGKTAGKGSGKGGGKNKINS